MIHVYNDGGRSAAGFKGEAGDCFCRAAAIVQGRPYAEVYREINLLAKQDKPRTNGRSSARDGVYKEFGRKYMQARGWLWTPTMQIGKGCTVHMRADELPPGPILVSLSKHYAAVLDGVCHDTYDPSREGTRCVYGYWRP